MQSRKDGMFPASIPYRFPGCRHVPSLALIPTLALATLTLWSGNALQRRIGWMHRYNLPGPVIGGLLVSLALLACRHLDIAMPVFDTSAKTPLMIAFFTTIGFGASLGLLKVGGRLVGIFLGIAIIGAILQNLVGAAIAYLLGEPPLLGVLAGSVTLTGGPATGLAFAPQFEKAGIVGAEAIAVAAAMCGILCGGLLGSPIATRLIHRNGLSHALTSATPASGPVSASESLTPETLLRAFGLICLAMWIGGGISNYLQALGMTLPAYIGAMLAASVLRNLDDRIGWLDIREDAIETLGEIALAYFLVLSLMTLELWRLASAALPLLAILAAQLLLVWWLCEKMVFPRLGKNYESAVIAGGFCGFMMGTTANAMANMDALTRRFGPAPTAFLIVPIVGAFFIDFANTLLVQGCLSWLAPAP